MANSEFNVETVLQTAPWVAVITVVFLAASTLLLGVLYFTLIVGAVIGIVSFIFTLISLWERKQLYQKLASVVILSGIIGLHLSFLPMLQILAVAFLVSTFPLIILKPFIRRKWSHG